jgi:hypothetical protein
MFIPSVHKGMWFQHNGATFHAKYVIGIIGLTATDMDELWGCGHLAATFRSKSTDFFLKDA